MDPDRFFTHSLRDPRIARILAAAIDAAEPGGLVRRALPSIPGLSGRIFALAIGKAAQPMAEAVADSIPILDALVITKHAVVASRHGITTLEGGHPIVDRRSVTAGRAALDFVSKLNADDLLICLISGGGSALLSLPVDGVGLEDIQLLTSALLASGATIQEINAIRRRLDQLKGGGLARKTKARIVSLILSDVIGDSLEAIASGPTVQDPTSRELALEILNKYGLTPARAISQALASSPSRSSASAAGRVRSVVIGNIRTAAEGARLQAQTEGFRTKVESLELQGEARAIGAQMAGMLATAAESRERPFCFIAGGETTVTIKGGGTGGRNQEVALASVEALSGLHDVMLLSLATDGEDGPTDAAGAIVTGKTHHRAANLRIQASEFLTKNDSYTFFEILGDLLKPGPTGTNVNDLHFMIGL